MLGRQEQEARGEGSTHAAYCSPMCPRPPMPTMPTLSPALAWRRHTERRQAGAWQTRGLDEALAATHFRGAKVVMPAHSRGPATSDGIASGMRKAKSAHTVMQVA